MKSLTFLINVKLVIFAYTSPEEVTTYGRGRPSKYQSQLIIEPMIHFKHLHSAKLCKTLRFLHIDRLKKKIHRKLPRFLMSYQHL